MPTWQCQFAGVWTVFSSLFFVVSRYMLHVGLAFLVIVAAIVVTWCPCFYCSCGCGVPSECYRFGTMLQLQQKLSTLRLSHIRDPVPMDLAGMVLSFLEKLLLIFHSFVFLCGMSWGWNMSQQIETINQLCCDAWMHDFDTCGNVPCLAPAFVLECSRSTGLHQTTCEDFTICNHGSHPSCMSMCKVERTGKIIAAICCHSFLGWFSL